MLRNDSKLISLEEAVALIPNGANCSFSGFSETNNPMSFVRQMIRAGKKHLEVSGMGDAQSVELLCGAKAIDLVRVSNYMARNGRCPNFSRCVENGTLQTEDYSHFGITNRFFAAAMGIPFMPVKVMIGSDMSHIQRIDAGTKIMEIEDPFTGEAAGSCRRCRLISRSFRWPGLTSWATASCTALPLLLRLLPGRQSM